MSENRIKVNKVAVYVEDDLTSITLYKTNKRLGELSADDLELPLYNASRCPNKVVYQNYCRDLVVHLLEQGGIDGYYWEPKQITQTVGTVRKYDKSAFISIGKQRIQQIIVELTSVQFDIECGQDDVVVSEFYKDKNIKFATAYHKVTFHRTVYSKGSGPDITVTIPVELKSGQLCRPKTMKLGAEEIGLNATSIKQLVGR